MSRGKSVSDFLLGGGGDAPEPGLLAALVPFLAREDLAAALRFFVITWPYNFAGRAVSGLIARRFGERLGEIPPDQVNLGDPAPQIIDAAKPQVVSRLARRQLAGEGHEPAEVTAALVVAVPVRERKRLLGEALRVAEDAEGGERALARVRLAGAAGPVTRWRLERMALAEARDAPRDDKATLALVELAERRPRLRDEAADRAATAWEPVRAAARDRLRVEPSEPPPGPEAPPPDAVGELEDLLASLMPEQRAAAAQDALWAIVARWGALAEPPPDEGPPPEPERFVNVGVASETGALLGSSRTLARGRRYFVALEIGDRLTGRAGGPDIPTPDVLPAVAVVTAVLYAVPGGFTLDESARVARLRLRPGAVDVLERPVDPPAAADWTNAVWFPVVTPDADGPARARVSLYCRATLVQSVLLTAEVAADEHVAEEAVVTHADFTLTRSLRPDVVHKLAGDDVSLLVNQSGDDVGLFLYGVDVRPLTATIDGHELQGLIETARGALRRAAWGTRDEWRRDVDEYQYVDRDVARLERDLESLAVAGFSVYDVLIDKFAERPAQAELEGTLRVKRQLQLATKDDPRFVVPAAMLYDRPGFRDQGDHTVCPAFLRALDAPTPLDEAPCFNDRCESIDDPTVVCPSGFWGFRHALGMPVSADADALGRIVLAATPSIVAAASTDPLLTARVDHIDRVQVIRTPIAWHYSEDPDSLLADLTVDGPAVVYLFCHGGKTDDGRPWIQVGPADATVITRAMLRGLVWEENGPLVFVNGCHTTDVSPEQAINLVSGFLAAQAAGVIGTEITILQELAVPFAESFLRRFLNEEQPLGDAVRGARLDLLKQANPLGLAYIPFASAGLQLVAA